MRLILSFSAIAAIALGQPSDLKIDGVTSTQAILSYIAPDSNACTVEVSEAPDYSTVVNDVNGVLFPGSNSDNGRAIVSGGRRLFIAGTRNSALGSDGKMYSRALRADRPHYVRVTCGTAATTTFATAQIQGIAPEAPPFSASGFGNFGYPGADLKNTRNTPLVDPQTGSTSWLITNPRDYSHAAEYPLPSGVFFQGASWTNAANATAANATTVASTSTANDPLFLLARPQSANIFGNWHAVYNGDGILTDLGLHLYGSGTFA
jgi:hypothetical protein